MRHARLKAEGVGCYHVVMSNHFHLLVEVPERGEVDEAELVRRMTVLYGQAYISNARRQGAEWRRTGAAYLVEEQKNRRLARMGDISAFVKTLKQRFIPPCGLHAMFRQSARGLRLDVAPCKSTISSRNRKFKNRNDREASVDYLGFFVYHWLSFFN